VVGVGKSRRGDGEGAQYGERNVASCMHGARMQVRVGSGHGKARHHSVRALIEALATGMWWALARAEEEMERAHNTESETWHESMHGGA